MATYKKRGYKPKTKVEKQEEETSDSTTAEVFSSLDEGASRTEAWVEKNQKGIFIFIGLVAVAVLGYLGFEKFIQEPKEMEASNEMYQAQNYFNDAIDGGAVSDSLYNLSLNGGEGKYGFLDIAANYSGTKAGNLAHYYAGMAFLNTNRYQEAIDQLEQFDGDDEILGPLAKGGIGDAFMQLNQPEEALDFYREAAAMRDNNFTTPRYLLKAAITAIELNQDEEAVKLLNQIKDEYPSSPQANEVELYLGMAKATN